MKKSATIIAIIFAALSLFACNKVPSKDTVYNVSGSLVCAEGAIAGAEISVNGQKYGTTDENGGFRLDNVKAESVISFTKHGYNIPPITVTSSRKNVVVFGIKLFELTLRAAPSDGGTVRATNGDTVNGYTLTAQANDGYAFTKWVSDSDFETTSPEFDFTLSANTTFTAVFERIVCDVQITSDHKNLTSGSGRYQKGETASLVAEDSEEYEFCHWTKNGTVVCTDKTYSFTVTEDATVEAVFLKHLTFTEFSVSENTLTWQTDTSAESKIFIDGKLVSVTSENQCDLSAFCANSGTYDIEVVCTAEGCGSARKSITYTLALPISTPYNVGVQFDDKIYLSFSRINSAIDYEIYVGNTKICTSAYPSLTTYSTNSVRFELDDFLTEGKQTKICVVAIAPEGRKNSSPSESIFVTFEGKLSPPQFAVENRVLTFVRQPNTRYKLSVNGVVIPLADNQCSVDLSEYVTDNGSYTVSLTAWADGYKSAVTEKTVHFQN